MYVPNYIPEPLEVPGNITQRPYRYRVQFIRQVVWLHSLSVFSVALLTFLPSPRLAGLLLAGILVGTLVLLDLVRIRLRGQPIEAKISGSLLPAVLLFTAWNSSHLAGQGFPVWSLLWGVVGVLAYTALCCRDFSFVGCYCGSALVAGIAIWLTCDLRHFSAHTLVQALLMAAVYLGYSVYDLASLLARRRGHEQVAAVVDLYRDVFNFLGYFYRCVHHWKKHRIWVLPKP